MNYQGNRCIFPYAVVVLGALVLGAVLAPGSTFTAILIGLALFVVLGGFREMTNTPGGRPVSYCLLLLAILLSAGLRVVIMGVFTAGAIKLVCWGIEYQAMLQGKSKANMGWVYICVPFTAIAFGSQIILGSLYTENHQLPIPPHSPPAASEIRVGPGFFLRGGHPSTDSSVVQP